MTLGLALGVGLVITVNAAATATAKAQNGVLRALYGVGTDVTVTTPPLPGDNTTPNHKVEADPATQPHLDFLESDSLGLIDASSVTSIARLHGVKAAVGELRLVDTKVNGSADGTGSDNGQQDGNSQQQGTSGNGKEGTGSGSGPTNQGQGAPSAGKPAPSQAQSTPTPTPGTPHPPAQIQITVDGVDPASSGLGPLSDATVVSGRSLRPADAASNAAVLGAGYAAAHELSTGSEITVAGVRFTIVGIVRPAQSATVPDVYIPLARAQALAAAPHKVDTIYVSAASAAGVASVRKQISHLLPLADVNTSDTLAQAVTGSLADAARLANDLGRWLAIAVLATAFAVTSLLTIMSVSRRVREFGTLKALGWSTGRLARQVLAESLTTGVVGAVVGTGIGLAGVGLISWLAPTLHASVAASPGSPARHGTTVQIQGTGSPKVSHPLVADAVHTVPVHFDPSVSLPVLALAVALAIGGALLAGLFGTWRAARLRPAQALARVE